MALIRERSEERDSQEDLVREQLINIDEHIGFTLPSDEAVHGPETRFPD